jgi:hypothetical protein
MPASITAKLSDMFPDTIIVERRLSVSGTGVEVYDTANPVSMKALIMGRNMMILGQDGKEYVSTLQAIADGVYNVSANDRFTLPERHSRNPQNPSALAGRQPKARSVAKQSDENGPHHEVVYFA